MAYNKHCSPYPTTACQHWRTPAPSPSPSQIPLLPKPHQSKLSGHSQLHFPLPFTSKCKKPFPISSTPWPPTPTSLSHPQGRCLHPTPVSLPSLYLPLLQRCYGCNSFVPLLSPVPPKGLTLKESYRFQKRGKNHHNPTK